MKPKFRINFVYTGIIVLALLLSAIISLTLYFQLTPWEMELKDSRGTHFQSPYFFRDLNNDGFSEQYQVYNGLDDTHYITIFSHNGAVIDQLNLYEQADARWVFFDDYSGDGFDECFVFTVKADSLYLYAFDIVNKKALLNRHYLMAIPDPHPHFFITDARLYDLRNNYKQELLFLVHAGLAPEPRGLYVFDFQKKQIINRFENHSTKDKLIITDLTGDGRDEIIIVCKANGNGPKDVPFTDWKNWIFFLDQNLDTLQTPLCFGGYPSVVRLLPVQIKNKRYLLLAHSQMAQEQRDKALGLYLINSQGNFARKQYFKSDNITGVDLFVDSPENPKHIFISTLSNQLLRFDADFNLTKKTTTKYSMLRLMAMQDLDNDGKAELITNSTKGVQIFDQDFNLLAEADTGGDQISIRRCGADKSSEIGLNTIDKFYHYSVSRNSAFTWLPLIFLGLLIIISLVLFLSNMLLTLLYTYFSYFIYSLKQTPNSVVLLRPNGRISYFNSRVQNLLNLSEPLSKKQNFIQAFNEYPDILSCITESIQSKEAVQKDFSVSKGSRDIKGQVSVIPFKTNFNYIYAYLLEIRDLTEPIISERQRVWSRTVKKMAHDIKTPLAAVQLNLETIQLKLQDEAPEAATKISEDFNTIAGELNRVREMTRQFLKFSNLEAPHFSEVVLSQILQKVKAHFHSYFNDQLILHIQIDRDADKLIADENQLEMAFQIFIENAIDALRERGRIDISTNLEQELTNAGRENVVIEIADSGPGIIAENQGKIFEPYFTTKKEGTGMGLAIAQKIIRDHSGEIELVSRENFGTVFRITLPKVNGKPQRG